MSPGDEPVAVHSAEDYDAAEEYVIDSIVAEKKQGKKITYLVKWKVIDCCSVRYPKIGNSIQMQCKRQQIYLCKGLFNSHVIIVTYCPHQGCSH